MAPFGVHDSGYNYSHAGMRLHFSRNKLGLLLGGFFIPMSIFSVLSLISFFVNPEVVPGRMGLLVTLYLIAANVYNSVNAPKNRGFSYIEVYGLGVQVPILFAIIEYGVVLATLKNNSHADDETKFWLNKKLKKVDMFSVMASAIFIILFNLIYWPVAINSV